MRANDWIIQRENEARREGSVYGALVGIFVGLVLMTAIHMALNIRSDNIHAAAIASIKQADAILYKECTGIVELIAEDKYENVLAYHQEIDRLQGRNK